jgi:hypothetical protein
MKKILLMIVAVLLFACSEKKIEQAPPAETTAETQDVPAEFVLQILQRIPSPVETSFLLKESGNGYDARNLNSPDKLTRYSSNFKKALNLGIYGSDLAYINVYEQSQESPKYLASIKKLADDLHLGQFFDLETIRRLAVNSNNLDSLLFASTQNFNDINSYLQKEGRSHLSALLLTGGWIEGLNLLCEAGAANPQSTDIHQTIGEQKIIFDSIMQLLSFYKDRDSYIAALHSDMLELEAAYSKVTITYTYVKPTYKVVNNTLIVKDNSTSTVVITPEDVQNITTVTKKIRNKIVD